MMVAVSATQTCQDRLTGEFLKSRRSVDQTSIKEHPSWQRASYHFVSERHFDSATQEGGRIDPWERRAFALNFFANDSSSGFFHDRVPAKAQLVEQS